MLRVLVLSTALLIAFPMSMASQEQPLGIGPFHGMTKDEFASFLDSLDASLLRWKTPISKIDVTVLHLIDYEEGKQIEAFQSICSQNLDQIKFDISALKQKQSVIFLISLLAHIDDFHHNLDALHSSFGVRPFPERTAQDIPKTLKWTEGLTEVSKGLYPLRKRLLEHSLAIALAADVVLNASPPKS
jgi:hypothetical protein